MPSYAHLADERVDVTRTGDKMHALAQVGVPYADADIRAAAKDATAQGEEIASELAKEGIRVEPDTKMVAMIAYLQRLGKNPAPPAKEPEGISMKEDAR
jgi:cytochrome c oxidase cbb3-type subunit I/II